MIKRISDGKGMTYEVGKDGVVKIEETTHGSGKTVIYKVTFEKEPEQMNLLGSTGSSLEANYIFIGLLPDGEVIR